MWYELKNSETIEEYNNFSGEDFVLLDTEFVLYKKEPPSDKLQKKAKSHTETLIIKDTELAIKYCQEFIEHKEQPLSRWELEILLSQELSNANDILGAEKKLPEKTLREIWREVPKELKRLRGVKTQKRKFELKAGELPWQI